MNKPQICAAILALLLAGCGAPAVADISTPVSPAEVAQAEPEEADTPAEAPADTDGNDRPRRRNENTVTGKITAVTSSEITIALAAETRPQRGEGRGNRQSGVGSAPESAPSQAEPPEGAPTRPEGGGSVGELEYTGETATYPIAGVTIRSGGPGESSGTPELAVDDVVRLAMDESGNITAITLLTLSAGTPSPETEPSEAAPST